MQEYYASGVKKGRTQTQEERLYGVFAEDSDEEYEGRKGKRRKKQQDSFSKPVGFVSGGITGSSTEKPEEIQKAERDLGNEAGNRSNSRGQGGLGFESHAQDSGSGLGFAPGDEQAGQGLGFGQASETRGNNGTAQNSAPSGLGFATGTRADNADADEDSFANLPSTFGKR